MINALVKLGTMPLNRMQLSRIPSAGERVLVRSREHGARSQRAICNEVRETGAGIVYFLELH